MLQTLLFFHVLAAIGLFTGISIDVVAVIRVQRATTLTQVRAAVLNLPLVAPIMILSVLLLLAMGISMIYAGGFGWTPGWINAALAVTIILTVLGPTVTGRKGEHLYVLAESAGDGPITAEVDAARQDRALNYTVFLSLFELIALLYVMVTKPEMPQAATIIAAAAVLAAVPAAVVLRLGSRQAATETA